MAGSTDTRVVQMQFDNQEFERNIAKSEKSLDKFKEALDFAEAEKSLDDFEDATKKLTFEKMAENIQKLTDKFTGLGTVSEFILSKIRHGFEEAASKAKRFFDSMTIDQVNAGFDKFGQLNKNVKTIMGATGRSEEDVYKVMERLNTYTDWTSYSFSDMAANIGKFTSVGVPLEEAEKQMEGIANWAARSGGGIQEASRAMYNLSQAMGVGALTQMDWKSIENAGMATKEFKEQLIEAGLAAGTLVKENGKIMTAKSLGKQEEVTYQNLRQTLSKKWADTEVMQKAFMAYYYEDITYTGEITSAIKTTKDQKDEIRSALGADKKITVETWRKLDLESEESVQHILDAAVEQKKILKEVNDEGYTVYKTIAKNGKQIELTKDNFEEFVKAGLLDETLATVVFNLDSEPLIEATEEQKQVLREALGEDNLILRKDWAENLSEAGLATDEFKQAAMDAAVAAGTLVKETDKAGNVVYKTAKGFGKEMVVNLDNFEESLKNKWFTGEVVDKATKLNDLGKAAYEAAQKCTTFTDVLDAWKDMLSTGWMQSFNHIFGEMSESMDLFTNVCNKVSEALGKLFAFRNGVLEAWANGSKWFGGGGRNNLWGLLVGEVTDDGEVLAYEGAYGILDAFQDIGQMISDGFFDMLKIFANPAEIANWDEEGFKEAFLGNKLNEIILTVKNFISSIRDFFNASAEGSNKSRWQQVQDVVNAIYATFVLAWTVVRDVSGFIRGLLDQEHLGPSIDAILGLLSALGLGIRDAADSAEKGNGLKKMFDDLLVAIKPLTDAINNIIILITGMITKMMQDGEKSGTFAKIWQAICDIIVLLGKIVAKVAPPIIDFISSILEIVADLFSGDLNGDKLKSIGKKLEDAITKLFDDIFGLIPGVGDKIQGFIAYIFGFAEEDAESEGDESSKTIIGVAKKWLRKIFGGFANLFDNIKGDADKFNLFTWVKDQLALGSFAKFLGDMTGIVKGTNLYGIIMSFLGGYSLIKLIGVLRKGKSLIGDIGGFFGGLKESLQDGFKLKMDDQVESFGDKFLKIAGGIALIVASVAVLGSMSIDSLVKGFAALAIAMAAIFGFLILVKKYIAKDFKQAMGMTTTIASLAIAILSISIGIGLLALMLKPLANMSIEGIGKMLLGLLGIVTIIGLFAKFVGKDVANIKGARSIAVLAIGIGLLIFALKPLAKMEWSEMGKMAVGLLGVLTILALVSKVIGSLKIKGGFSIGILAIGIGLLILSLQSLKDLNDAQLKKMAMSLIGILGILVLFSRMVGSMKGKAMGQVILLSASIWILMQTLMPLADMQWEQLAKMGVGLLGVILILTYFTKECESMKGTGMGNVLMIAGAIWILMQALMPLANMEWEGLAKIGVGLLAVSAIIIALTRLVGDMNLLQGAGIAIMLVGFAAVLLTFGVAMNSVAGLSWNQILAGCLGIIAVIAAFALIQRLLLNNSTIFDAIHTLLLLAGLAVVMIAFSIALNEIKNVDTDKITAFSIGLSILLAAVAVALAITSALPAGAAIKGILVLSAAVAAIIAVFALVGGWAITTLSSSLTKMAANLKLFSGMIADFSNRMNGVDEASIEKAKRVFGMLGELFKNFGGIVVGAVGASALSKMMSNLKPTAALIISFSERMEKIKIENIRKAKTVIDILATIGESLEKITDEGDDPAHNLSSLVSSLTVSAGLLITLNDRIAKVEIGNIAKTGLVVGMLAIVAAGLSAFATEDGSDPAAPLTAMVSGLTLSAGLLIDFSTRMNQVDDSSITKLQGIVDKMKLLMADISLFEQYLGKTSAFTTVLFDLGTGIEIFNNHTGNVGDLKDNSAVQLIKELSGCAGDLDTIVKMDLDKLTSQLTGLGGAMMLYAMGAEEATGLEVSGEGTPDVSGAVRLLREISTSLTENGGFQIPENMPTKEALGLFGAQLAALAGALVKFEEAGSQLGSGTDKALECLDFFRKLKEKLVEIDMAQTISGVLLSFITGEGQSIQPNELELFGKNIEQLGLALKAFATATTVIDESTGEIKPLDYTKATEALESFAGLSEKLPTIGGIRSWWTGNKETLIQLADDIMALGQGLKDFSMKVTGQTDETYTGFDSVLVDEGSKSATTVIDKAIEVLNALIDARNRLPKDGGIVSIWEGEQIDFYKFGSEIAYLGQSLHDFCASVTGQNGEEGGFTGFSKGEVTSGERATTDIVDHAVEVLNKLIEARGKLPKDGGIASIWEGDEIDFYTLGGELVFLGQSLQDFSMSLTGSSDEGYVGFSKTTVEKGETQTTDIVDKAVEIIGKLVDARTRLADANKKGGLVSIWEGDEPDFHQLGGELETLGGSLRDFSDQVTGTDTEGGQKPFDADNAHAALGIIDEMIAVMNSVATKLPKIGGIGNFFSTLGGGRESNLTDVSDQIGKLGTGLAGFADAVNGKFQNVEDVTNALGVVNSVVGMIAQLGYVSSSLYGGQTSNFVSYIQEFVERLNVIDDRYDGGKTAVQSLVDLMGYISEAVEEAGNIDNANLEIFTVFTQALNNLATMNLSTVEKDFENVGANIAAGVRIGIEKGQSGVINAAVDMAVAAYNAACTALDEHSPSRLFMGVGAYVAQGMAIGIQNDSDKASNASKDMAYGVIDSAEGILTNLSDLLTQDIDAQPTIRPVLDLTNVTNGTRTLNSLFGQDYGIGLDTARVNARASRAYTPIPVSASYDQNGSESGGMMARMDAMIENVMKMGENISNLKLVLDSGVVAGGVANGVDVEIGRNMFYAERRN